MSAGHSHVHGILAEAGVSMDDFMGWVYSTGRGAKHGIEDARKSAFLALPDVLMEEISKDAKGLSNCIKLYGTKK